MPIIAIRFLNLDQEWNYFKLVLLKIHSRLENKPELVGKRRSKKKKKRT